MDAIGESLEVLHAGIDDGEYLLSYSDVLLFVRALRECADGLAAVARQVAREAKQGSRG